MQLENSQAPHGAACAHFEVRSTSVHCILDQLFNSCCQVKNYLA